MCVRWPPTLGATSGTIARAVYGPWTESIERKRPLANHRTTACERIGAKVSQTLSSANILTFGGADGQELWPMGIKSSKLMNEAGR